MVAQRFPSDFDGIIAGAPANNWSHLMAGFIWNEQALLKTPASAIPPARLPDIQNAVMAACDTLDGVKDGLLEDPRACHFDPAALLCRQPGGSACLSAPQLEALKSIYAGPRHPRTGETIFPGYPPGTEAIPSGWSVWITPSDPASALQFSFGNSYFGQAVLERPSWDYRRLTFDSGVAQADRKAGSVVDSTNPDLRSYRARGGKLIQYHGWGDAAISPLNSIDYYESVRSFFTAYPDSRTPGHKAHRRLLPPVHGSRHGPLRARRRSERFRPDQRLPRRRPDRPAARHHGRARTLVEQASRRSS